MANSDFCSLLPILLSNGSKPSSSEKEVGGLSQHVYCLALQGCYDTAISLFCIVLLPSFKKICWLGMGDHCWWSLKIYTLKQQKVWHWCLKYIFGEFSSHWLGHWRPVYSFCKNTHIPLVCIGSSGEFLIRLNIDIWLCIPTYNAQLMDTLWHFKKHCAPGWAIRYKLTLVLCHLVSLIWCTVNQSSHWGW